MGKIIKNKTTLVYKGVKFDSDEEVFVAMWLQELQDAGLVKSWSKVTKAFPMTSGLKLKYERTTILKTKTKVEHKEHTLLRPSEYTPDFEVLFSINGWLRFNSGIYNDIDPKKLFFTRGAWMQPVYLEVKPSFDQNNMERLFKLNQKFLWDKEQIFVNLVEPLALFEKTFLPLAATDYFKYKVVTKKIIAKGKKKGDWKLDFIPKTLKEYLDATMA